jgi:hypothetical protein
MCNTCPIQIYCNGLFLIVSRWHSIPAKNFVVLISHPSVPKLLYLATLFSRLMPTMIWSPDPRDLGTSRPRLSLSTWYPSNPPVFLDWQNLLIYISRLIGIHQTVVFWTIYLFVAFKSLPSYRPIVSVSYWLYVMQIESNHIFRW